MLRDWYAKRRCCDGRHWHANRHQTQTNGIWYIILRLLVLSDNHVGFKISNEREIEAPHEFRRKKKLSFECESKRLPANQKIIKKIKFFIFFFFSLLHAFATDFPFIVSFCRNFIWTSSVCVQCSWYTWFDCVAFG